MAVTQESRRRFAQRCAPLFGRLLTIGSVVAIVVVVVNAALGIGRLGVSNDEPIHVERTNTWLDSRWYLPEDWVNDQDDVISDVATTRLHTYGGAFSMSAHAVAVAAGVQPARSASFTSEAYEVRHVVTLALAAAGAGSVGYATVLLTRRRSIGMFAAAATLAMPLWTGYGVFAVKDVPAGAGWTMVTAGCIAGLVGGLDRRRFLAMLGLLAAGVWFSIGTRIGLWVPISATVLLAIVLARLSLEETERRRVTLALCLGPAAAAAAIAAAHPHNAATPVSWLWNAAVRSADFDEGERFTLTAGTLAPAKPSWSYLPLWFATSVPILLGVLACIGTALVVYGVLRRRSGPPWRLDRPESVMVFWLLQAAALPAFAILARSTLYGGLRHHVYAMPALAALAAFGVHRLSASRMVGSQAASRAAIGALAVLAITIPVIDQVRLTPYAFSYKNVLAGSVDDQWETDMHWVSAREALRRVPASPRVLCYKESTVATARQPSIIDCTDQPQIAPFLSEMGQDASSDEIGSDVWVIARRSNASPPAAGCTSVDDVTRPLRTQDVVMSYVLRCDPSVVSVPTARDEPATRP
jgi:hypothetical protein